MEWRTAFEEVRQISNEATFGAIASFSVERDLIDSLLNLKRLGKNLMLFLDEGEQFVFPNPSDYKVITKQQLPTLDDDRNLHLKLFLFGKRESGSFDLQCLIGSCNATGAGILRNIEFWSSTAGRFNLPFTHNYASLNELFEDSKVDPSLANLAENCVEENGDKVVAPAVDLLWRLVRERNGLDGGIEFGRSSCLSDALVKIKEQNAIFVHTFGDNSLKTAIQTMVSRTLDKCQKRAVLYLILPYYNWPCLNWIVKICEAAIQNRDITVQVRLLTDFPPDYQERYLTESFDALDNIKPKDQRIIFTPKFWTNANEIEISEIILDQNIKSITSAFIHGKAIVVSYDDQAFEAIIGSANLTSAAISLTPVTNLEGAVWERNSDKARSIFEQLTILWEASTEPTPSMMQQLANWKVLREETILDAKVWMDAKEAIKKYVQVQAELNGQKLGSRNISLEELGNAAVALKVASNVPKINLSNIKCVWLPNLDSNLRSETKQGPNNFGVLQFSLNSLPISKLFYRITVPTKLLREASIELKTAKDGKLLMNKTFLMQETYLYALSGKTAQGWVELTDYKERDSYLEFQSKVPLTRAATLRVYDRQTERELSVGWDYVTITKRRPQIAIEKACTCPRMLCLLLRENADNQTAKIYPESIELSFDESVQSKITEHITNGLKDRPYERWHAYKFSSSNPLLEGANKISAPFPVTIRFLDENYSLRRKRDLYANAEATVNIGDSISCNFSKDISIIDEYIAKLRINQYPATNKLIDISPITFELNTQFFENASFMPKVQSLFLEWEMLMWGRSIKGKSIEQEITYPSVKLTLKPDMLAEALGCEAQNFSFEGTVTVKFLLKLSSGWLMPLKNITIAISRSEKFIKNLFSQTNLWNTVNLYTKPKKNILDTINQIVFSNVSKHSAVKDFDTFVKKQKWGFQFEPGTIGNKGLNCQGFCLPEFTAEDLIERIADAISLQFSNNFALDTSNPSLPTGALAQESKTAIVNNLRKTTIRVEEGIVIFPNLILRKLGLDPMPSNAIS